MQFHFHYGCTRLRLFQREKGAPAFWRWVSYPFFLSLFFSLFWWFLPQGGGKLKGGRGGEGERRHSTHLLEGWGRSFFSVGESPKDSYLVDPASSHMLVSKIKPCMSKYKQLCTVKLRMAH